MLPTNQIAKLARPLIQKPVPQFVAVAVAVINVRIITLGMEVLARPKNIRQIALTYRLTLFGIPVLTRQKFYKRGTAQFLRQAIRVRTRIAELAVRLDVKAVMPGMVVIAI